MNTPISHKKLIKFFKENDEYTHFPNKIQFDNKKIQNLKWVVLLQIQIAVSLLVYFLTLMFVWWSQCLEDMNCWLDFKVRVGGVVTVCSGGEGYSLLVQRQDLTSAARLLHVHPTPLGHVHCGKRLQNKHKHHWNGHILKCPDFI